MIEITIASCYDWQGIYLNGALITQNHTVSAVEGNYKQGKPGDYLMRGIDGELYICDGYIFERSYDFVGEE